MSKFLLPGLLSIILLFSGCSVVTGIFKAGVWVGTFIVLAIIAIIVWIIMKAKK